MIDLGPAWEMTMYSLYRKKIKSFISSILKECEMAPLRGRQAQSLTSCCLSRTHQWWAECYQTILSAGPVGSHSPHPPPCPPAPPVVKTLVLSECVKPTHKQTRQSEAITVTGIYPGLQGLDPPTSDVTRSPDASPGNTHIAGNHSGHLRRHSICLSEWTCTFHSHVVARVEWITARDWQDGITLSQRSERSCSAPHRRFLSKINK